MFGRLASAYFHRQPGAVMDKVPSLLHIIGCKDCKIYMNSIWQREAISQRLTPARRWHLPSIQMVHDAHTGHRLISMLKRELTCTCDAFYPIYRTILFYYFPLFYLHSFLHYFIFIHTPKVAMLRLLPFIFFQVVLLLPLYYLWLNLHW